MQETLEPTTESTSEELQLIVTKINDVSENLPQLISEMQSSSEKAKMALSGIKAITTDEEDNKAMLLLGKVKTTYEGIKTKRESITKPMDNAKAFLMQYEKMISILPAETGSDYNRVKVLRDGYANKKFKDQQEAQQKAERDKAKRNEIARLESVFVTRFHDGIVDAVSSMRQSIQSYFNSIKLDTFDEQVKKFNLTPTLKQQTFESLFIVDYDKNVLPVDEFTKVLNKVKETFVYEEINKIYIEKALPVLTEFKSRLPELRKNLQAEADLAKTNAEEAERLKVERETANKLAAEKAQEQADKEKADKAIETENNLNAAKLENEFVSQVATQEGKQQIASAVKKNKATITCEYKNLLVMFNQLLFTLFTDPTFPGLVKKDKEGKDMIDENGRPVYLPWVEFLLSHYADHSDKPVEGITINQVLSTITKRK